MNETQDKTVSNQVQPVVIPSRGGFFSREVLLLQGRLEPDDMGSGEVVVVFVNSATSTQHPDEVRASIEPLLQACNAKFVTLEAGQRSVAQTIMEYAQSINASLVITATLPELHGVTREGPTVQEMYEYLQFCRVLTINVIPPEIARA
jgi:hypothetical protein